MKKKYILIAMLFASSVTFAQMFQVESVNSKKFNHVISTPKTPTDTTGFSDNFLPKFAVGGQVVTYNDMSGGYAFGVNGHAFGAIAQGYNMVTPGTIGIDGVCMLFCGKTSVSGDATSKLTFSIYNKPDSIPTTQVGTTTADLLFSDCDTTFAFNTVLFPSVINVSSNFTIVCSFADIKTDTIGFFSDQDGEGKGYTALKYQNTWLTYVSTYHILTNMCLFALVDMNSGNVNDNYFIDGIKLSQNQPNPTTNTTLIQYEIQNNADVTLEIYDITGRLVLSFDEGKQIAGRHDIFIDSDKLNSGTYYYSLKADNNRMVKKMIISK